MLIDHSTATLALLQAHLGGDRNFCYLLGDQRSGQAAVVDPGFDAPGVLDLARRHGLKIKHILITHGHSDHTGVASAIAGATGATIHAGPEDRVPGAAPVIDGQRISVGELDVTALSTPGHSPGHICYLCAGNLFTGDLLFCGKVGGTGDYFAGSSAAAEWDSLHRLLELPDPTRIFPGHDYYGGAGQQPNSSIGFERLHNPFLLCADFDAFTGLKANWTAYKAQHGIR